MSKIIVIGSCGQIGTELVLALRSLNGAQNVIAADLKEECPPILANGPYLKMDILDREAVRKYIIDEHVEEVYLLAALLSATAEKNPDFAWRLNMEGLFTILDLAKERHVKKVFWPSSIAVFGPTTPRDHTPQFTVMEPSTVYGISKQAGERWCEYYFNKYNVDVRSIRYPGLISWKSEPGGGTTDYAVDIFHKAIHNKPFECFLSASAQLPMIYMEDAIRATLELMEAPKQNITIRSSYNIAGMSFTPNQLFLMIRKTYPKFTITYHPDFRQEIADTWPNSIDDSHAVRDWSWSPKYDLESMTYSMIKNLKLFTLLFLTITIHSCSNNDDDDYFTQPKTIFGHVATSTNYMYLTSALQKTNLDGVLPAS